MIGTRAAKFGGVLGFLLLGVAGCSPRSRATTAASVAWSCPEDRIQLAPIAAKGPAEPPAEIAGDPARLAIWKRNAGEPTESSNFSATGCGKTGTVSCFYDNGGSGANWRCVESSSPPRLTAIKEKVEDLKATAASTPEALDAMAKQLEALNEPGEAARLRVRATALRMGGAAPAPEAPPPPAPPP